MTTPTPTGPTTLNTEGMTLAATYSTSVVVATTMPLGTWAGQVPRTILRVIVPVQAGDVLDVDGWLRCTNDCGYTVGVESGLWQYDCDPLPGPDGTVPTVAARPWALMGPMIGDNVDAPRHHLPQAITAVYQVPADWPAGHRMVVVLRADAASTAAQSGDAVTVDPLGVLTVRRWTALTLPAAPTA